MYNLEKFVVFVKKKKKTLHDFKIILQIINVHKNALCCFPLAVSTCFFFFPGGETPFPAERPRRSQPRGPPVRLASYLPGQGRQGLQDRVSTRTQPKTITVTLPPNLYSIDFPKNRGNHHNDVFFFHVNVTIIHRVFFFFCQSYSKKKKLLPFRRHFDVIIDNLVTFSFAHSPCWT